LCLSPSLRGIETASSNCVQATNAPDSKLLAGVKRSPRSLFGADPEAIPLPPFASASLLALCALVAAHRS
jgi:hypothetical protein